ncbi:MAG: hypothetical protein JXA19_01580 [Anaerolineales bacterium]|nr:hypothetical protein [Anaerolineales bacterium]
MMMKRVLLIWVLICMLASGCMGTTAGSTEETETAEASIPTLRMTTPTQPVTHSLTPTQGQTSTPTPTCLSSPGELIEKSISIPEDNYPFEYLVYLPPCYGDILEQEYPILYLIHGMSFRQDQWPRLGVISWADEKIANGEVVPFIMVFPRDRVWRQPSEDPFDEYFVEYLIPEIEADYPIMADRQYHAIGGLSRGAGWAIHLGLPNWEYFGIIGAHSFPLLWEDTPFIVGWVKDIPFAEFPRVFFDYSDHDYEDIKVSTERVKGLMEDRNIAYYFFSGQGYHEEVYWSGNIDLYMSFYTSIW